MFYGAVGSVSLETGRSLQSPRAYRASPDLQRHCRADWPSWRQLLTVCYSMCFIQQLCNNCMRHQAGNGKKHVQRCDLCLITLQSQNSWKVVMARGQQAPFSISSLASPFFSLRRACPCWSNKERKKEFAASWCRLRMVELVRWRWHLCHGQDRHWKKGRTTSTKHKFMHQECYLKLCLFFSRTD